MRKAGGELLEIEQTPVEYYNIDLPTSWVTTQATIPEDDVPRETDKSTSQKIARQLK